MPHESFTFDFHAPRVRYSTEKILVALRTLATLEGGAFPIRAFDTWKPRPCTSGTVIHRFGSWAAALEAAGIQQVHRWRYTPEELVARLEQVWRELGRRPGSKAMRRLGNISVQPYKRRWGSLERACSELALFHAGAITREVLLAGGKSKVRKPTPARTRWKVMRRDGFRCVMCGDGPRNGARLHVDHILPVSRGGGDDEANLRTLCARCNIGRGNARGEEVPKTACVME